MAVAQWPSEPRGLAFGGDYNPEQWPRATWEQDLRLMQEAGVDLVTIGVFSWALLEPEPGRFDFGWLDEVMDLVHHGGISVDLATATASPPAWLAHQHPEILPVTADGRTLWPGGRQAWCPSSPVYREHALRLVEAMANRYGGHPALVMWHVSNEMGCHNVHCYCDVSAQAFRSWLRDRYGDLDALNQAWGTAFWSQHYSDWEHILPPRAVTATVNPSQRLDFARFSSDSLLDHYRAERDVLRRITPDIPVTTNFMVTAHISGMDYWSWADDMDVIANDHYLDASLERPHVELAFAADLMRGLAGGRPWMLMEHSTSAVNWQPHNLAKSPGEMARTSLQHVARGSDAVLFFQWRASRAGAEKFHSALVPHAGTDSKVWRESVELGGLLDRLDELAGSTIHADVALVFDWQCWWACQTDNRPSLDLDYLDRVHALYASLWDLGVTVDVVRPGADLTAYRLVLVPSLYLVTDETAAAITAAVEHGATAVITYWSGIVDENDHVRLGGYPGAFRQLLGVRSEEFFPLLPDQQVTLDDGSTADTWTEWLHLDGAQAVASYLDGPLPGVPAVTRHDYGQGTAWYAATRLDAAATSRLMSRVVDEAGVAPVVATHPDVEVVRRSSADASFVFVLNHQDIDAEIKVTGIDLLTGAPCDGSLTVPAGGCAVVRERV